jgi:hypothetical protein
MHRVIVTMKVRDCLEANREPKRDLPAGRLELSGPAVKAGLNLVL